MNPIKAFFKKKELDSRFKKAGRGHRLTDGTTSSHSQQSAKPIVTQPQRHEPNEIARRAGEAALARLEQKQVAPVNWSLTAIRAQAKKELELEVQAVEKEKNAPKEVYKEGCELLTVSGVYFHCPMIGPYVLSRQEIDVKIKEFLYSQLSEEPGLTACLIIHSCNRDQEKVRQGIETLGRYLANIIDNPKDEKYQKIRINNKVFQDRVAPLEGVFDFLIAASFEKKSLPHEGKQEEFFVFNKEKVKDLEDLQMLKEALLTAEPVKPVLDRNKKVLMPSQINQHVKLPDSFFNLSPEEILKEQEAKAQAVEINSQLRTKAMRERGEIREMRLYRYTLIRVRFPDGIILQGTFNVREKLKDVREFIVENLANPNREFLLLAPGGLKLTEMESTLLDLKLVPAVVINLHWHKEEKETHTNEEVAYLKNETMCLIQNA